MGTGEVSQPAKWKASHLGCSQLLLFLSPLSYIVSGAGRALSLGFGGGTSGSGVSRSRAHFWLPALSGNGIVRSLCATEFQLSQTAIFLLPFSIAKETPLPPIHVPFSTFVCFPRIVFAQFPCVRASESFVRATIVLCPVYNM